MASTNETPNYGLPQFVDSDKPAWLTDFNTAMLKIDEAIHDSVAQVSNVMNEITQLKNKLLITSNELITETFTIDPSNPQRMQGSLGHQIILAINASGTPLHNQWQFQGSFNSITIVQTPTGEFKTIGALDIRRTAAEATDTPLYIVMQNILGNKTFNLKGHSIITQFDLNNAALSLPGQLSIKNGTGAYVLGSATTNSRYIITLTDSIITQQLVA